MQMDALRGGQIARMQWSRSLQLICFCYLTFRDQKSLMTGDRRSLISLEKTEKSMRMNCKTSSTESLLKVAKTSHLRISLFAVKGFVRPIVYNILLCFINKCYINLFEICFVLGTFMLYSFESITSIDAISFFCLIQNL